MSFRSLLLSLLPLLFQSLVTPNALAASTAPGKLNLYDDYSCKVASTLNPTVTLPLSTCLVTPGGEGLVIALYPECPSGTASLIYYQDTTCGVSTTIPSSIFSDKCFQLAAGVGLFTARSVMFACQPAEANPQPSSTTTAVVSQLAPVATGSPTTTAVVSQLAPVATGSPAGNGNGSTTSAAVPEPTSTSNSGSGGGNSNPGTSTSSSSSSGLSTSDIVAIAVGLGVGIPTITITLLAWLFPDLRRKLRGWTSSWLDHTAFRHEEQQQWGTGNMQGMRQNQHPGLHNPVQFQ